LELSVLLRSRLIQYTDCCARSSAPKRSLLLTATDEVSIWGNPAREVDEGSYPGFPELVYFTVGGGADLLSR
jgi:hypothetical protein